MADFDYAGLLTTADGLIESTGKPVVLRQSSGGTGDPWKAPTGATVTLTDLKGVEVKGKVEDASGTIVRRDARMIIVSGSASVIPTGADKIAIGIEAADVDENTQWFGIGKVQTVRPGPLTMIHRLEVLD